MKKPSVLFICVHNSARSQMAEAFLQRMAPDDFAVTSAGFAPTQIHPLTIAVMQEVDIDLSEKSTLSVFELYKHGKLYDYVITVCNESADLQCPVFPGVTQRHSWPFTDPAAFSGTEEEQLDAFRRVRDAVRKRVEEFVATETAGSMTTP